MILKFNLTKNKQKNQMLTILTKNHGLMIGSEY